MGLDMTLHVPNSGSMPDFAQAMAAQWQDAGIRVEIQLEEENEYWVQKWLDVDLGVTWWGDRVSPQIYLDLAYRSGATWNESHWQDERLDELIDFTRIRPRSKKRGPKPTRRSSGSSSTKDRS